MLFPRRMIRLLLLLTIGLSVFKSKAQYTYGGINLSYHNFIFSSIDYDNTALNELRLNIGVTHRFLKFLGAGAQLELPLISGFKYNFYELPTTDGNTFSIGENDPYFGGGNLQASEFSYNIRNTSTISLYPRFYLGTTSGVYIDLRYNLVTLNEEFVYQRGAVPADGNRPALEASSINYNETHTLSGYGIRLGAFNHVSDHIYIKYSVTVDVYNFDKLDGFYYYLPYSTTDEGYENVLVQSMISGVDVSWQLSYGVGYFF